MSEHEQTPFVIAFGKALFAVPDPCPWCGGVREYHPTSGGSSRLHSDGCGFFAIQHEHDKAVAALSARVAKLEAALRLHLMWTDNNLTLWEMVEACAPHGLRLNNERSHTDQVCAFVDAKARAALEEPCKGDSPEAAEDDKS